MCRWPQGRGVGGAALLGLGLGPELGLGLGLGLGSEQQQQGQEQQQGQQKQHQGQGQGQGEEEGAQGGRQLRPGAVPGPLELVYKPSRSLSFSLTHGHHQPHRTHWHDFCSGNSFSTLILINSKLLIFN